jgi:hypothetical protein
MITKSSRFRQPVNYLEESGGGHYVSISGIHAQVCIYVI